MADGAEEDEEMEDGVHVAAVVERVEDGSGDVADTLGDNPHHGGGGHAGQQGLERHEHRQPHQAEADGLYVAVVFQSDERGDGACDGRRPDEGEQGPAPGTLAAQGDERDGRVGSCDVPVDGGMVPPSQPCLPARAGRQRMIDGRGNVGTEHAEEVERNADGGPAVGLAHAPDDEHRADDDAQQDARGMAPRVPKFFLTTKKFLHNTQI